MIKKNLPYILLALFASLLFVSYAGGEKKTDPSASVNVPETFTLGDLAKIYQPVSFSHEMHSLVAESCAVCHHHSETGQTPSCTKCHATSVVSEKSSTTVLREAYHRQCIGCHKKMEMGPTGCADCHTKSAGSIGKVVQKASEGKKSEKGPDTFILNALEKQYEPVMFSHGTHTQVADDCATCHHRSGPEQTLACKECHRAPFDPKNLNMPGLKGAYHLQCMGCHKEMGSGPVGCTECHAKKISQTTAIDKK
ncbi:MAG: cytochrome c family protein [candidate division Zixibacteria bacterium]|nr:cytochrome c family protein [candidate division Zixibacteria bacterium]